MQKFVASCLFSLLALVATASAGASVTATVDRTEITEFDMLTLTIRVSGMATDAEPDFSRLEQDFEQVNIQTRQSSSISIVNGQQSSKVYKDYVLTLRPRRLGNLTIPPIQVGAQATDAIPVEVTRQSSSVTRQMNQLVFFDTSVSTNETYVQGQVVYTVKLFYADAISGDFPPPPDLDDAIVETIESEKRYESIINSRRYYVLEKQYAIFPQRSGQLTIPRETFIGTRGRSGLFSARQRVNAVSEAHAVKVNTIPASFPGNSWLPAADFKVREAWAQNPPSFRVGEPVNRIITMQAVGAAPSLLPPLPSLNIENAKTYADPAEESSGSGKDGITATVTTTVGIVPVKPGELVLPEIRIPWWNTQTNRLDYAVVPEATYQVLPALGGVTSPPTAPAAPQTPGETLVEQVVDPLWQMIAIGIGIAWAITLGLHFNLRRQIASLKHRQSDTPAFHTTSHDEDVAFGHFTRACKSNDAHEAHRYLFLWAKARYPTLSSTQQLVQFTGNEQFTGLINELELALFSPAGPGAWNGKALMEACRDVRKQRVTSTKRAALADSLNPV